VFNSIGPTELIIVLVIVLVIFGPKRLPGLGRSLGSGMKEFRDSLSGKGGRRDLDDDEDEDDTRHQANARRGRGRLRAHAPLASIGGAERVMATALRPIHHEDRLSLVEHLDELRTRIIFCIAVFVAAFALCFWQNDRILDTLDRPLQKSAFTKNSEDPLERSALFQQSLKQLSLQLSVVSREMARSNDVSPALRAQFQDLSKQAATTAAAAPKATARRPVTLGVGEPFTVTFKVVSYAALLLSLPILLYQAYAFILPAFSPKEREIALPLMALVPFLFVAGVVFAYYTVLPNAIRFLQNFNDDNFDILLQARDYYKFSIMVLAAMGCLFQVPIGILAVTRVGIVTPRQLRKNRRYAILVIAIVAMLLPGQDPVTMLLLMAPLVVLFEGSILLAALVDRRAARARAREEAELDASDDDDLAHDDDLD
jgi:sec-independent protein translocase protein TatC